MTLAVADLQHLSSLLDEALDLSAPERSRWLAALPDDARPLTGTLRDLLARHAEMQTGDFLPAPEALRGEASSRAGVPAAGAQVGPYRLLRELGTGGMGAVWLAERADGLLDRKVALKLPHVGWSPAFAERFAREREILSTLEHPHIARLYDAGVDQFGRPYMALEYVEGEAIDAYCRGHKLDLRARVTLLLQVAEAVAFAHARLVVHRDIKPGNILVTPDGQVRLLDFGIAKLVEGEAAEETELTRAAGRALTPHYASPEQVRGGPIGTASDVYSLGMVAFELLADVRPHLVGRNGGATKREVPAPHQAPRASATALDPALKRQLRGDVDAILAKALEDSTDERYATVADLADDLHRWLQGEPVRARPDGAGYRTRKFVARHRTGVALGALVTAALLVASTVSLWQAARARAEAARAQAVQTFLVDLFRTNTADQADPERARLTTAREMLDIGASRLEGALHDQPAARLLLLETLGGLYRELGLLSQATRLTAERLALARTRLEPADPALALALVDHAQVLDARERDSSAEVIPLLTEAMGVLDAAGQHKSPLRARLHMLLAEHLMQRSVGAALAHAERAVRLYRELEDGRPGLDDALETLASVRFRQGDHSEAATLVEKALQVARARGRHEVQLATLLRRAGEIHAFAGNVAKAEPLLREALAMAERVHGPKGTGTITLRLSLARHLAWSGRTAEARALADRALADARWPQGGTEPFQIQEVRRMAFEVVLMQGDMSAARALVAEAFADFGAAAPDSFQHADLLVDRAIVETEDHRFEIAESSLAAAAAMAGRLGLGPRSAMAQTIGQFKAEWHLARGEADAALAQLDAMKAADGSNVGRVYLPTLYARAFAAAGRSDAAGRIVDETLDAIEASPDRDYRADLEAHLLQVRGGLHRRAGDCARALPALERAAALFERLHVPASSRRIEVASSLSECRVQAGSRLTATGAGVEPSALQRPR